MLICYTDKKFGAETNAIITMANSIIEDYEAQGFTLTLRQLYYQFVARDLIPNTERSYKRLGNIISDARLAGLISWEAIEDRTRWVRSNGHWDSPAEILESAARGYQTDLWKNQPYRVEVWIEKDALVGVIEDVCSELDVSYFACRGYVSQSEMWRAGQRFNDFARDDQRGVVLHLGDHDPSGIDMTRDIGDRLDVFCDEGEPVIVKRIALNMDQIEKLKPPPNPAKLSDTRAATYISRFGRSSWELDALEPSFITRLIRTHVAEYMDQDLMDEALSEMQADKDKLTDLINDLRE